MTTTATLVPELVQIESEVWADLVEIDFGKSSPFMWDAGGSKTFLFCSREKMSAQKLHGFVRAVHRFLQSKTSGTRDFKIPGVTGPQSFLALIQPILERAGLKPITPSVVQVILPYWAEQPYAYLEKDE